MGRGRILLKHLGSAFFDFLNLREIALVRKAHLGATREMDISVSLSKFFALSILTFEIQFPNVTPISLFIIWLKREGLTDLTGYLFHGQQLLIMGFYEIVCSL